MANKDNKKNKNIEKWEKVLTWIGFGLVPIAAAMPFIAYYLNLADVLTGLGEVGDYIGGTTVTFLTGASVFLLIATNIMQREELKISRKSIDQLVEQTAASVQQAEASREETKITNETMKKQQFETTFFNMVTLHQNIVGKLQYEEEKGNGVIELSRSALRNNYYEVASFRFKSLYLTDDYDEIVDLIKYLKICKYPDVESVQTSSKSEVLRAFKDLDFRDVEKFGKNSRMIRDFIDYTFAKPNEDFISEAYHNFDVKYDSVLGSYFNSIATIIKFLRDSQYETEDRMNNKQDNKIYREIFFSQFSPNEMMVIYYYAKYRPDNEWLLEELKAYNLFYPRLVDTLCLFWAVDRSNIEKLSK
ncbi:putative phage abortive infection protein [Bacillus cereus]|uniref:Phage abortive infection protein n=1 Tax=Bacillus cereus (strain VD014) TaxID=1053223 RepID=A0A9W5NMK2_BACC8|nr:putative phage abortive infection protein [Bacillus cereus]EJR12431.1 hypothetical protein IIA_05624 [Bacillus cereus VD014]